MAELLDIHATAAEFLALAAHQLATGEVDEAENTARAVLKIAPKSAAGWHMLGDVLSVLPGRRGEASDAYDKAVRLDPEDSEATAAQNDLAARATLKPNKTRRERGLSLPYLAPSDGKERLISEARAAEAREQWQDARKAWETVLEIDPSDTWAWSQYGHLLSVNLHQYDDAEAAFRRAVEEDPTDDWAWGKMGIMLADFMGRVKEGQEMLRRAITLDPGECYYHGWLGWSLYRQSNDLEGAERELMEAARLWPDYQWAFFHLGFVRMEMGDRPKKAEEALLKADALQTDDIPVLYALASLYEEQLNRPRKAIRIYERLAKLVPTDPLIFRNMGMLYQSALGEPQKAVVAYEKALSFNPTDFDVLTRLGWLHWEVLADVETGLQYLNSAAEQAPDSAWVCTHMGQALHHGAGRIQEAEQWFLKALENDSKYDWAHAMLGALHCEQGTDLVAAEHHLREAVRISPDYTFAWARLGRLMLLREGEGGNQAAWQALTKALELSPGNIDALSDIVWMGIYRLFRPDLVLEYAEKLVSRDGSNAFSRVLYSYALRYTSDDPAAALAQAQEAINLQPDDHYPWHAYGEILLHEIGDLEGAEEALLRAASLQHDCASTDSDLGLVRYAIGRYEAAPGYFERALEHDSECAAAWRAYGCFLHYSGGDTTLAEEAMERAIALEEENFEGWALMAAFLMLDEDRADEVQEFLGAAQERAPEGLDVIGWAMKYLQPRVLAA
ncbi:MAG: tetratricopeptide repeat protein [Alphaproteobacteria bacterium]|nr:tetratricopeptide repeat protein [Alphaproteobacteria bacterium]